MVNVQDTLGLAPGPNDSLDLRLKVCAQIPSIAFWTKHYPPTTQIPRVTAGFHDLWKQAVPLQGSYNF